jgi:hypothetical protein
MQINADCMLKIGWNIDSRNVARIPAWNAESVCASNSPDVTICHIPECPFGGLEERDAVSQQLTAILTKAQWSLSGAFKHELRLAFYHVERLTRPPSYHAF